MMTGRMWAAGGIGRRVARVAVVTSGVAVLLAGAATAGAVAAKGMVPAAVSGGARGAGAARILLPAGDSPAGFRYGTGTRTITISGSAPYREPVTGGYYGGSSGMTGNWARWMGCGTIAVCSGANSRQANTSFTTSP